MNYIPRNDFVVFKLIDKGKLRGINIPQISSQGKERVIVSVGPKVENLKPGDRVFAIGTVGEDVVMIPTEQDLYLTRESNIVLIVKEDEEE